MQQKAIRQSPTVRQRIDRIGVRELVVGFGPRIIREHGQHRPRQAVEHLNPGEGKSGAKVRIVLNAVTVLFGVVIGFDGRLKIGDKRVRRIDAFYHSFEVSRWLTAWAECAPEREPRRVICPDQCGHQGFELEVGGDTAPE